MVTRKRLLIVDDEPEILEIIKTAFPEYDTVTALNVESALLILREHSCHALITDIRMPGVSGLTLVAEARRLQPQLPVIVITGHRTDALPEAAGVVRWIMKPFRLAALREAVEKAIVR